MKGHGGPTREVKIFAGAKSIESSTKLGWMAVQWDIQYFDAPSLSDAKRVAFIHNSAIIYHPKLESLSS